MITQSVGVPRTAKCRGPTSRSRKRIVQRQRMRDAGLVELRRHHPDVVGQRTRDLLDDLQAGGMDAVVIGAENSHPRKCPFRCLDCGACSNRSMPPSYPSYRADRRGKPGNAWSKQAIFDRRRARRRYRLMRIRHGRHEFRAMTFDPQMKFCSHGFRRWLQRDWARSPSPAKRSATARSIRGAALCGGSAARRGRSFRHSFALGRRPCAPAPDTAPGPGTVPC